MAQSRTKASITNSIVSFVVQIGTLLFAFIQRTVLIKTLGVDYLGLDGLFSNVLSLLNMVELGFGSALVYSMYKPMAYGDEKKLNILLALYAKVYNVIGGIILVVGLSLSPFITCFINDIPDIPHIQLIYCMYVINASFSYFFVYKSSIITVAQENYIVVLNKFVFYLIQNLVQIVCLMLYHNYILYFGITIICTLASNISISRIADKRYPYITCKVDETLDKEEFHGIKKNVSAMFLHKIGGAVVFSTDNLLISKIVSVTAVGLYSNYSMIVMGISSLSSKLMSAATASIGNLGTLVDGEEAYKVFRRFLLLNHFIATECSICLYVLLSPFVKFWLGEQYILQNSTVALVVLIFYIEYIRKPAMSFREAYGLFWNDRYKPIAEVIVNLGISIVLGKYIGINGIFIGTIASFMLVALWVEPYVLFKHAFRIPLRKYFAQCAVYVAVTVVSLIGCVLLTKYFLDSTIFNFVCKLLICVSVPFLTYICLLHRTDEFKYYVKLVKSLMSKRPNDG